MKDPYIAYYEHIAKLSVIANKQTLFLSHILCRMEFDSSINQLVVNITATIKRQILRDIGAVSKNPLALASQYLSQLQKAGLIKSIGGGCYLIDPESFSYAKYIPKNLRVRSSKVYEKRIFTDDSFGESTVYIELDDGEIIDVEDYQPPRYM